MLIKRLANPRIVPARLGFRTEWNEERKVLGPDPWVYGLGEANRKNLETIMRYCHQQGLIGKEMPIEELFVDTDPGDAGGDVGSLSNSSGDGFHRYASCHTARDGRTAHRFVARILTTARTSSKSQTPSWC